MPNVFQTTARDSFSIGKPNFVDIRVRKSFPQCNVDWVAQFVDTGQPFINWDMAPFYVPWSDVRRVVVGDWATVITVYAAEFTEKPFTEMDPLWVYLKQQWSKRFLHRFDTVNILFF